MGVRKLVEVSCDFRDCERTYVVAGGTQTGAWTLALSSGWNKRGIWTLCPDHARAEVILR